MENKKTQIRHENNKPSLNGNKFGFREPLVETIVVPTPFAPIVLPKQLSHKPNQKIKK